MNYMDIKFPDTANGPGIRVSLFVSGCHHHCKGCFNPESWDFHAGKPFDQEAKDRIREILKNPYVSGLSLLGGEPMDPANAGDVAAFVRELREEFSKLNVWCWTGYTLERILYDNDSSQMDLLGQLDVLVDGQFEEHLKNIALKFRGSENQRIIDCRKTLEDNRLSDGKMPVPSLWIG